MSATKVFIAGFPYETTEQQLRDHLKPYGKALDIKIIFDREGKPKGFAFVEMATEDQAKALIRQLDGSYMGTRKLFVNEYKAKAGDAERPPKREYPSAAGAPSAPPPGPPGGVERRSGVDRRKNVGEPGGPRADRREFKKPFGDKKPWGKKPFGEKRPWGEKKPFGEKKPWQKDKPGFGDKKPFEKKPWQKERAPGEAPYSGERKPGGFAAGKKPWVKKPGFGKKPFGKPGFGKKPFKKPE